MFINALDKKVGSFFFFFDKILEFTLLFIYTKFIVLRLLISVFFTVSLGACVSRDYVKSRSYVNVSTFDT